ncbi:hypothetical protein Gohar_010923 [Gossypium harknessii]|uniref:Uncharacterized protein n=1 Tax=Gossypium harknessii TaxID=34285 RepID=A0A7J9GUP3_9ROSI|nr:hypothetical protein [Gossypium harknessii]
MPTVKITRRHLHTDSHCPVCKDKFEVGTTRALFAVKNCHHKDQVAARVITPGVKVGAAILEVVPVEGRAKAADVIHFHISGHSVRQIQALAIMELREVVPHGMCMRAISRWGIMDGLLTEVCSCVYL